MKLLTNSESMMPVENNPRLLTIIGTCIPSSLIDCFNKSNSTSDNSGIRFRYSFFVDRVRMVSLLLVLLLLLFFGLYYLLMTNGYSYFKGNSHLI